MDKDDLFLNRHHGLILIELTKSADEFVGHVWEDRWLPQMAEKKKLNCAYVKDEVGRVLLTGDSVRLREFVERLPIQAFDSGHTLTRIKGEQAKFASPPEKPKVTYQRQ